MKSSNTSDICADYSGGSSGSGGGSGGGDAHNKVSTSYAQKVIDCKKEDDIKSSSDVVDGIAESINNMTISDDELFADPPPKEECPICMLPMPCTQGVFGIMKAYMPCCGKMICEGCLMLEDEEMEKGNLKDLCSFCREPPPSTDEEFMKILMKRANANDPNGFYTLGGIYRGGVELSLSRDISKAFEMYNKAAELGLPQAHYNVSNAYFYGYFHGYGVGRDTIKAARHLKLAAIGGDEVARHKLGIEEAQLGNMDRAMRHFMIAARVGFDESLKEVGNGYKTGYITKDDYASTLRAHQSIRNEMKSEERTRAAANRL